ncbi:MGMT family protein [Saccharibacillus kuerlensis]|uniref:MGMT family protein n=1 Tax=Saccharibacillus kuerlensis TaxID=459527 RepID=UPI0006848262|nr:MGMT family protein [Saccharibacillus kuerlensis]
MAPFTRAVVQTIQSIPEGKVMSYGQVASAAGSPRGARQVVRILHSLSRKYGLPWHRVVNIRGEIALDEDGEGGEQQARLEAEGVEFGLDGRIDLKRYRYQPDGELQAEDRKADDTKRVEKAKANRKG